MMGLSMINHLCKEAERKAKRAKLRPLVLAETVDVDHLGEAGYRIPNFGDYRPKGWKLLEHWQCDSSGLGQPHEPALTQLQLVTRMKRLITEGKLYGYAIIEEGQFQLQLGVFEKDPG
jgi:hypothetical protein